MNPSLSRSSSFSTAGHAQFWHSYSDARRKAPKSENLHRVGPAAIEDVGHSDNTADIGTLDSDVEEEPQKLASLKIAPRQKKAAGSRALLIYFSKLAKKGSTETIDYRFLDSLFRSGAKVNACDKHGQTALYEVARNWNVDVARYFFQNGAALNHTDKMGRSPLHLAAAVNHSEMVKFLIENGADIHAKTFGEGQTPIHFAAKYDAVGSLKVLLERKAYMNCRDYKNRTPLYLAAEMAQEDSARFLVDYGAPVGVFDDTGMPAIGVMIDKMPNIALDALNQFRVIDPAFRKEYYYLNYLEYDPKKWREENTLTDEFGAPIVKDKKAKKKKKRERELACPTTPLHLAVEHADVEIIMHEVIQKLIKEKWRIFGRLGAVFTLAIHFLYVSIWIFLAIFLPPYGRYYDNGIAWRLFLEFLGVLLTFFFIVKLVVESKIKIKDGQSFRLWRRRQINRDLEYCHPRWAQERIFLESELKSSRKGGGSLLSDPWNILEFFTIAAVLVVIVTRLLYLFKGNDDTDSIHRKAYTLFLILMCLHFMKSCRPFTTLGPFITMLGHVIVATGQFVFIVFEFYIPYTVGIWIMFGGDVHAKMMDAEDADSIDWKLFNDLMFSMWQVMLNVDFNMDGLYAVNRQWAQILVGTYFAFATVLCLNLYIALLSETFNNVYQNAKANASLLQANTILQMENILPKKRRKKLIDTIQDECGPLITQQEVEDAHTTDEEMWDRTVRAILKRFTQLNDFLKEKFGPPPVKPSAGLTIKTQRDEQEAYQFYQMLWTRDREIFQLMLDLYDLKYTLLTYLGERHKCPPRPVHKPLPPFNVVCPQRQILLPPRTSVSFDKVNSKLLFSPRDAPKGGGKGGLPLKGDNGDLSQHSTQSTQLSDSWETLPEIHVTEDGYIECSSFGPSGSNTNLSGDSLSVFSS